MRPDARTRRTFLIAAAMIFAVAVIWLAILESRSYTRALCTKINSFGYHAAPSDFYTRAYGGNTSINEVIGEDLTEVIDASKKCGFEAEVEKVGKVELMLWDMDESRVMVVYLVDRVPEIVFIENTSTGEVSPIGPE
ncbi:MAG: hypothetical protein J5772_05225 [Clostridia bacterium]|nr:hypothetical protein [Clostridia bacterium]